MWNVGLHSLGLLNIGFVGLGESIGMQLESTFVGLGKYTAIAIRNCTLTKWTLLKWGYFDWR